MSVKFNYAQLGGAIKSIRELRCYTQSYIAIVFDINQSVYSRIENGICAITIEKFLATCDVLSISPFILLHIASYTAAYITPQNSEEEIKFIIEIKERMALSEWGG
jgi:transcriptional regulator with XRE-family HTH domain